MRVLFHVRALDSLGVGYLMSVLEAKGHDVELLFDPGVDDNQFYRLPALRPFNHWNASIARAAGWKPDLVAFSTFSNNWTYALEFARRLKRRCDVPFVFGGVHASALPDHVLRNPEIDYVCRGEGEEALPELVDALSAGGGGAAIRNIAYRQGDRRVVNPVRPPILDLDRLPFPHKGTFFREGAFRHTLNVIASRGCPNRCSYCVNSFYRKGLYGPGAPSFPVVRRRSPANVVEEIATRREEYPIRQVYFCDEVFTLDKAWLTEFLDLYSTRCRKLPFYFTFHHRHVDDEVAAMLARAGAIQGGGAIETADEGLKKKVFHRHDSRDSMLDAMRVLKRHGIATATSAIYGIPFETEESRWATLRLVEEARPDVVNSYVLYPFPGTDLLDMALKDGFLDEDGHRQVMEGLSSYHRFSLFKGIDTARAETMAKLTPLYVMGPRRLKPLVRAAMKLRIPRTAHLAYIATAPFLYAGYERDWFWDLFRRFVAGFRRPAPGGPRRAGLP
jgi:anaerobic magnesium-protoporphyrin IX monomethyl ester cyclase